MDNETFNLIKRMVVACDLLRTDVQAASHFLGDTCQYCPEHAPKLLQAIDELTSSMIEAAEEVRRITSAVLAQIDPNTKVPHFDVYREVDATVAKMPRTFDEMRTIKRRQ